MLAFWADYISQILALKCRLSSKNVVNFLALKLFTTRVGAGDTERVWAGLTGKALAFAVSVLYE